MELIKKVSVRNWQKWQSYRNDRGAPPWIKVHRNLLSNSEWSMLSDAEKGQLVSIWIVAADKNGVVPGDPAILRKICMLDKEPNLNKFIALGFIENHGCQDDANVASSGRQHDAPDQIRSEENRGEDTYCSELSHDTSGPPVSDPPVLTIPLIKKDGEFPIAQTDINAWQETFPGIDVLTELRVIRQWSVDNPSRRKTRKGIRKHISGWLARDQDRKGRELGNGGPAPLKGDRCEVCDYNQRERCSNLDKPGFDRNKCGSFRTGGAR